MENVIELENEVREPTINLVWFFKNTITLTLGLGCAILANNAIDDGLRRFNAAKETYLTAQIAGSLEGKRINFDKGKHIAIPPANMSREELLRALYVLNAELERKQQTITYLKDFLSYE